MAMLDVSGQPTGTGARFEFFSNIARYVIHDYGIRDRRWFIAYDSDTDLPDLDRDCVVFVYGDERSLLPWRYRQAGLILKCMGHEPYRTECTRLDLAHALDRVRIARNRALNARLKLRLGRTAYADLVGRTLPFPLGYARQPELPLKPFATRRYVLWFSGSSRNTAASRSAVRSRMINEPKFAARRRMAAAVDRVRAVHPDWPIDLALLPSYAATRVAPPGYADALMDTKIALVPRGTTPETHRFFEAMRAGCVVVGEPLPDFWFYRSAPSIRLRNWAALPAIVEGLMARPERLQALHEASRRWWAMVCSPAALAGTVAGILRGTETVAAVEARA